MKVYNVTVALGDPKYWHTTSFTNVKAAAAHTAINDCVRTARRKPGLKGLHIREVSVTCTFVCTIKKPAPRAPAPQEVTP